MLTGYLVKPLRASSLAARLTASLEIAAPSLVMPSPATSGLPTPDLAIEAAIEPAPHRASIRAAGQGLSILVAEDNEINAL